jgi:hypothetical protein
MTTEKSRGKLLFYAVLLLIIFFGFIGVFVNGAGWFLGLEIVGFFFLLFLSLIALIGYNYSWGERVLFFVFLFYMANLVLVWFFVGPLYLVLLFLGLLGFLISAPRRRCSSSSCSSKPQVKDVEQIVGVEEEPHSEIFERAPQPVRSVRKHVRHSPGKYIASKRGKYFHEPKSEWAKKITKSNQLWFATKEEAYSKGYKAHSDVA